MRDGPDPSIFVNSCDLSCSNTDLIRMNRQAVGDKERGDREVVLIESHFR